ncbi:hypothetical protein ACEPAF_8184 [Sanghuangporus sanghuang]
MHSTQNAQLSSLSLVLPRPPLPKRTSSIRSSTESFSSPRTPRNSLGLPSPTLFKLDSAAPRRSTDSWNSSIHDGGDDDMDCEWTSEQLVLLSKTLDALPSHLFSPFNGSVPPPNILDKISRSIIYAKDPLEWPHSIRSTRIKLLRLARGREHESGSLEGRQSTDSTPEILQPTTNVPKKPLYRQSSMDFLKGNTLKNEKNIDRLSTRLQRIEQIISNPACSYEQNSSGTLSPHLAQRRPLSMGEPPCAPKTPKTEDNTTAGSRPSLSSSRGSRLRRTTTTLTGLPTIPSGVASDCISADSTYVPRAPKVKRSESFSSPNFNGLGHSLKRAPSYGSVSSRMSIDDQKENDPELIHFASELDIYPSSDEEEKTRSQNIKKQKTAGACPTDHPQLQAKKSKALSKTGSTATIKASGTGAQRKEVRSRKSSAKKILCTFGAELPNPQMAPTPPVEHVKPLQIEQSFALPAENIELPPATPNRRLRRVKTTSFPPRVRRRISFGHLSAPAEINESAATGSGLESAIQLR